MSRYAEHVNPSRPAQNQPARADQVKNNAGGFVFAVSNWTRLDRFLVLGADGPTYYVSERQLVRENAKAVEACIAEDGLRTVARIVEVSDAGRAPKNDPAIFALALAASAKEPATRAAALAALPKVCRIGTHILHFANDVGHFRGWGPALRKAISHWYSEKTADALAYDVAKYQQRDSFAQKDLMRLAHPRSPSRAHAATLAWATKGIAKIGDTTKKKGIEARRGTPALHEELPALLVAIEELHATGTSIERTCTLIRQHRMPHECVPNEMKGKPEVWSALLESMGMTAVLRNLGKMSAVGLLRPMSPESEIVCQKLSDQRALFKARIHPLAVLIGQKTYASGHGLRGSSVWNPVPRIVDILDETFYQSFQAIEPTGKRIMLALDVSGSMACAMGTAPITCREAAAAMAMATARTESRYMVTAFTCGLPGQWNVRSRYNDTGLSELTITPRQRLDDIVKVTHNLPFGGTDCSLPMIYAYAKNIEIDAFVVYTDSETWAGEVHPHQALHEYRQKTGIPAKLVVVGMVANKFSIADPNDAGMMDVVGFDAAAPAVLSDFIAAREVQP
jgi:60 kDa SS-A/Ro ribonucleoprotein